MPRGQGTGPAEVNLLPLFRNPSSFASISNTNYAAVLSGSGNLTGRYGPPSNMPSGSGVPGLSGTGSLLTQNASFPYNSDVNGNTYWANFAVPGFTPTNASPNIFDAYGTPPDPQTFGAYALDRAGRPLYISLGGPLVNGPYDLDLTRNAPHAVNQVTVNNPFGAAELESILRCNDRDVATLPQRLASLTNNGNGSFLQKRRAEITTESNWVPVASGVSAARLRQRCPRTWGFRRTPCRYSHRQAARALPPDNLPPADAIAPLGNLARI